MPSSVVADIKYDENTATLTITFVSGRVYEYKDVPAEVYQGMKASGSKGEYLNHHIKGNYKFRRVDH